MANQKKCLKCSTNEVVDTDITRLARLGKKVTMLFFVVWGLNHDLTIEQRKEIKTLTDEAKENSDKEKNGDESINDLERKTSGRKIKDFDRKDEKRDKIYVLILTETWHRSHDEISVLSAKPAEYSYVDYLRPYDANHGGLIIYFRSILKFKRLELPQLNTFEAIALKNICNRNDYLFLAIYRPGSLPVTPMFFKELSSVLESMTILTFNLVVAGGVLDLIAIPCDILTSEIQVFPSGIYSDHGLVEVTLMKEAGTAALRAADFKNSKYAALADSKIFQPVCIETFGPTDFQTQSFLNELCSRIVEVSVLKEPSGISAHDGRRPDGCTLIPWRAGRCLAWDVTVPGTLAERYVNLTSKECGLAAARAADEKMKKYGNALP
ncbi:hypothetical protein HELRODRAFT_171434 [Helobdella robusta]|uniref:Uncharacterized protein n=1 Tax=Helobdella robusta TaxID=6412 RepID=T1F499_HELRO|nr:hypothetical protein HELRODRAFT_171434 [Helobdella robusta]ESO05765.1 hypothetical protein HELRODRAFT_171434 [Helobdella robusta]